LESFGEALLKAGTGLAAREAQAIVTGDLKIYDSAGLRFGISQVEVTDHLEVEEHLARLGHEPAGARHPG